MLPVYKLKPPEDRHYQGRGRVRVFRGLLLASQTLKVCTSRIFHTLPLEAGLARLPASPFDAASDGVLYCRWRASRR